MKPFALLFCLTVALAFSACTTQSQNKSDPARNAVVLPTHEDQKVTVLLPLFDGKTHSVAWNRDLTVAKAIASAGVPSNRWHEAWRIRPGAASSPDKIDVLLCSRSDVQTDRFLLKPGDQVTVDLPPID